MGNDRSAATESVYVVPGDVSTEAITSSLQALTRELRTSIVASGALVAAIEREAAGATLLEGLTPRGSQILRGRDTAIDLWAE